MTCQTYIGVRDDGAALLLTYEQREDGQHWYTSDGGFGHPGQESNPGALRHDAESVRWTWNAEPIARGER